MTSKAAKILGFEGRQESRTVIRLNGKYQSFNARSDLVSGSHNGNSGIKKCNSG